MSLETSVSLSSSSCSAIQTISSQSPPHPTPPLFCAQRHILVNLFSHASFWLCSLMAGKISDFAESMQPSNQLCCLLLSFWFVLLFGSVLTQVLTMQPKLASNSASSHLRLLAPWIIGYNTMPASLTYL